MRVRPVDGAPKRGWLAYQVGRVGAQPQQGSVCVCVCMLGKPAMTPAEPR